MPFRKLASVICITLLVLVPMVTGAEETYRLQKILFADTAAKVTEIDPTSGGKAHVLVRDVPALTNAEFGEVMRPFVGRAIDVNLLKEIAAVTVSYGRQHGWPSFEVQLLAPQDVTQGSVRFVVVAGPEEVYNLAQLLISDTTEKAMAMDPASLSGQATVVRDVPYLAAGDFKTRMNKFIGRKVDNTLLKEIIATIVQYAREHDRLVSQVEFPNNQSITNGTLRVVVHVGRYNELSFRGNRWFSRTLLEQKLGIKPGDEVRLSTLEEAVDWANTNPFRQVKVLVNELPNKPGSADLLVAVQEARPIRLGFSYDDSGNAVIGKNRYTGSIQFGNLWGRDHQAFYQYLTADNPRYYHAHGIDYKIPLPWRHFLQMSGSYTEAQPIFGEGKFQSKGRTAVADLRYTIPLRTGENPAEFYAGFDYKRSNNDLLFGGQSVYLFFDGTGPRQAEVYQFTFGASKVQHDKKGGWVFGAAINASPGNFTPNNRTTNFGVISPGASATYAVASVSVQRLSKLAHGWDFYSRFVGQIASTNLMASEQLGIGGASTVRGFDSSLFAGDDGFAISNDLAAPAWHFKLPRISDKRGPLETRFLMFYDAGHVFYHHPLGDQPPPIASAGVGLRMAFSNIFSLNLDYGWHLTRLPLHAPQTARGHIKAVLSF